MCTNFQPSTPSVIQEQFSCKLNFDYPKETWKGYIAPIIRLQNSQRIAEPASFGLIPPWCKSAIDAKKLSAGTMNARSETVAEKPSFKSAWRNSHYCLVPMQRFYEPCYESGKAVRYSISMASETDFCAAGIWSCWINPETQQGLASFSMLTLNADEHPVLKRLHKPDDEKRSLFIVPAADYDQWLHASPEEARLMLSLLPAENYLLAPAQQRTSISVSQSQLF